MNAVNIEEVTYAPEFPPAPSEMPDWWCGDPLDSKLTAASIINANYGMIERLSLDDINDAVKFYNGEQWEDDVMVSRGKQGRPTLTINKLHLLVSNALQASREEHEWLTPADHTRLIVTLTVRNMDAQRMFNYLQSVIVEQACLSPVLIRGFQGSV